MRRARRGPSWPTRSVMRLGERSFTGPVAVPHCDFQHLPSWRELVVATALSLRRHHADTLIVPMSLIRDAYRAEILGGLTDAGEEVLHVFLEADVGVLQERLNVRARDGDWERGAREFGMT